MCSDNLLLRVGYRMKVFLSHSTKDKQFAPGVFLPPPPHDFVGRAETLELLYVALKEEVSSALLHGEPGCGKSTLALKFAWQTQGAFDAVVFQLCGHRPVAEIAAELATKSCACLL